MLVLVILAAGAAIAVPRYSASLTRARLDAATRQIVDRLNFARETAEATSSPVTVSFDAGADEVVLQGLPDTFGSGAGARAGSGPLDLSAEPFRTDLVSHSFFADNGVIFDAWGRTGAGGRVELSAGDMNRSIEVEAGTGAVSSF